MVTGTEFKRMICDSGPASQNPESVKKLIFCSGKVYYDLIKARRDKGLEDKIAISTLEQISPFPYDLVSVILNFYLSSTWGGSGRINLSIHL